jgi:hypothetical protein
MESGAKIKGLGNSDLQRARNMNQPWVVLHYSTTVGHRFPKRQGTAVSYPPAIGILMPVVRKFDVHTRDMGIPCRP